MDSGYWLFMTRSDYDVATLLKSKSKLTVFSLPLPIDLLHCDTWGERDVSPAEGEPPWHSSLRACIQP